MTHRTLIIPDIHNKHKIAEAIIDRESPDLTVFLGDYFDSIGDGPEDAAGTARWLAGSLECDQDDGGVGHARGCRIHLIGNHDLHYMSGNRLFRCNGYDYEKKDAIDACGIDWSRLRLYHWLGGADDDGGDRVHADCSPAGWLCTHAGFANALFEQQCRSRDETVSDVLRRTESEMDHMHDENSRFVFLEAGHMRGGPNSVGGILWCDYEEFEDIPHVRQIFGHTRDADVRHGVSGSTCSEHYCIDTVLCNYAVCEDYNEMIIKSTEV